MAMKIMKVSFSEESKDENNENDYNYWFRVREVIREPLVSKSDVILAIVCPHRLNSFVGRKNWNGEDKEMGISPEKRRESGLAGAVCFRIRNISLRL